MSIIRRVNLLSQARLDLPDLRAVESAVSADFDSLAQSFVTGSGNAYVLNGFNINMSANPIGGAASNLQVVVANGSLMHTTASQSGTFYLVPAGTANVTLNSSTVSNVTGAFVPGANNYVGIDYYRFQDSSTDTQRKIWDPATAQEDQIIAPAAIVLNYEFVITSSVWASNVLPIAIVTTDSSNNVISITDCRPLLFRLGTGGANPNPFNVYAWPEGQTENSITTSSANPTNDCFYGADKGINDLKSWMDSIMSQIQAITGSNYWYQPSLGGSLTELREDVSNTILTGNGSISHGVIPNATPVLSTTGNTLLGSNQLTSLASTTGIVAGQYVIGAAFVPGTLVNSVSGSTVSLSQEASDTTTGSAVSFSNPVATAPGQINWSNTLNLTIIGSNLNYKIAANPSGNTVTLSDGQAAYIQLVRDVYITPNLNWTNSSAVVTSVGNISWTTGLQSGDWVKTGLSTHAGYYKILSVDSAYQVTLTSSYTGTTTSSNGTQSQYAFGNYTLPGVSGNARDIQIVARGSVPIGQNYFWLFSRNDNGGANPSVYIKWLGVDLNYGISENFSGPQIQSLLQYVGSPVESATAPQYVSAYNVWEGFTSAVLPQVCTFTTGAASTMASGQYFETFSSGNGRTYYVWVKKDGSGSDPQPIMNATGIEWDITTGQTSSQTAASLVTALNSTFYKDFAASASSNVVTVTNNSAGATATPVNVSIGVPFTVAVTQAGTGSGNIIVQDGDNITLAVKKLDYDVGVILGSINAPTYDETVFIVASGATPPGSLSGPISSGTNITLPNNSRNGNIVQYYQVGSGRLGVFLNGQFLDLESGAYSEVGTTGAPSNQIQINFQLVVGDELSFRFSGSGGSGKQGPQGAQGAQGPQGVPGINAFGNPVSVSTKNADYTLALTDFVILGDCTSGSITFNLPTAALGVGRIFLMKKIDSSANTLTIQPNGAELIDGAGSFILTSQYQNLQIVSSGTAWYIT